MINSEGQPTENSSNNWYWKLLLLATIIASLVSFLTTLIGLTQFFPWWLSLLVSAAVQIGLLGLAWTVTHSPPKLIGVLIPIYLFAMTLSVIFSYAMFQVLFLADIRPNRVQRDLIDELAPKYSTLRASTTRALNNALRAKEILENWRLAEDGVGGVVERCGSQQQPYLQRVCKLLRATYQEVAESVGVAPKRGGGSGPIFYTLVDAETDIQRMTQQLAAFYEHLNRSEEILTSNTTNRQRIETYQRLAAEAPKLVLSNLLGEEIEIPSVPLLTKHGADAAPEQERPGLAITDLRHTLQGQENDEATVFWTLFALACALYIDSFVLAIAFGARTVGNVSSTYPAKNPIDQHWKPKLLAELRDWLQASAPDRAPREFASEILNSIRNTKRGAALTNFNDETRTFARILVTLGYGEHIRGRSDTILIQEWVHLALVALIAHYRKLKPDLP